MAALLIKDTFDTARLVAFYRALESERSDAHFHDPYARALAGERGEELMRTYARSQQEIWAIVARTCVYDELICHLIEQEQVDTIINLAAGLDTRPYRLSLPASLRWIEADLPGVLTYKEEILARKKPACLLERRPLDVADHAARRAFLANIGAEAKQAFVLTEGLLIYLTTSLVAAIASDLYEQSVIRWWLTEFISPFALKREEKTWNALAATSAQVRFAPSNGSAFFQQHGWCVAEFRSPLEEMLRLGLPVRFRRLLRLLARLGPKQNMAGMPQRLGFVMLERAQEPDRSSSDLEHAEPPAPPKTAAQDD